MTLAKQIKDYAKYIEFSKVGITPIQYFHKFTEELASRGEEYGFFIDGPYDPINKGNLAKCHLDATTHTKVY
jgi:hypothetical protein